MKKVRRSAFKLNPLAAWIMFALASPVSTELAFGNAGFGTNVDLSGATIAVPTFYANSPQGKRAALDANNLPVSIPHVTTAVFDPNGVPYPLGSAEADLAAYLQGGGAYIDTGKAIRKFVDPLVGAYDGLDGTSTALSPANPVGTMGIPVGIPDQWVDSNGNPVNGNTDDFYEIAVVEYLDQMHSDLAKPTRIRGYVQVETANIRNKGLKDQTGVIGSEHIPAHYLTSGTSGITQVTDPVDGKSYDAITDMQGNQVYFVHAPHYLGPTILATHGKAVRILFHNYLPYTDVNGNSVGSVTGNGGEMMIPVDETIAGGGPITDANGQPVMFNGKPMKMGQNRVSIHWHGGDTPWTNDGTPHQWFAPGKDIAWTLKDATHPDGLGHGPSFHNVPDMPDPGPGSETLYFPNQELSGRLMMYHDHASGITRTNAYIGEAAGYIVLDPTELNLAASTLGTTLQATANGLPTGLLDSIGIPLIIQDKGFLPKNIGPNATASNGQVQSQDAKWDTSHWGQEGDLFFPHVYETNQDPNSIDGTNPVGRWDWGPWFWPVFPSQYSLPTGAYGDVTTTPEAFMDTPIVNGQAYPTMTVDPKAYRFRMLSIANDRTFSFGLYEAVDGAGNVCDASVTPVPNPTAPGETAAPATCTELRMVPAAASSNLPAGWPTDGRAGGVPDPLTVGPDIVQVGNEAGLLPAVAVWPSQPITYDQNVRSMTVYNILGHQLLLAGAERADVFIDFTKYAGKTLILYNDAPAPSPGFDTRLDYYTGVGDQTPGGGAYDTLPGYGPNTRTVMQIKVNASCTTGNCQPLNVAALKQALPVAYAATQPKPIIPETAYNTVFPGTSTQDNYARIFTGSLSAPAFTYPIPGFVDIGVVDPATGLLAVDANGNLINAVSFTSNGSGYKIAPQVTVTGGGGTGATAQAVISTSGATNGQVTAINFTSGGSGYTSAPSLVFSGGVALDNQSIVAPVATVVTVPAAKRIHVINKAIQELFDPVFGRMNATLAVELPFSSATIATTIPLAYVDTPIDYMDAIADGETQIWKITHNGVDSHPVHFHLVNVQVINRVDWAGVVKPPEANELGWKETLRMNPLEDVYVAVTAKHPVVPFGLPTSTRLLDPSQVQGSQIGFTQIDPMTGNAPTFQRQLVNGVNVNVPTTSYSNQLTDFGNEYVWHCHILGHEEFDFMRPFVFRPTPVIPDAPGAVTVSGSTLTWTDPTPFGGQDAQGVPTAGLDANGIPASSMKNEIGFKIEDSSGNVVATVPANTTTWADASGLSSSAMASLVVVAYNAAGDSVPGQSTTSTSGSATAVTVSATATAAQAATVASAATASANVATAAATAAATASANTAANTVLAATVAASPISFAVAADTATAAGNGTISLVWGNNPLNISATGFTNVTGYALSWNGGSASFGAKSRGATVTGLTSGNSYTFNLVALGTSSSTTTPATSTLATTYVMPAGSLLVSVVDNNGLPVLNAGVGSDGVTVSWTATTGATGYTVTYTDSTGANQTQVPITPVTTPAVTTSVTNNSVPVSVNATAP